MRKPSKTPPVRRKQTAHAPAGTAAVRCNNPRETRWRARSPPDTRARARSWRLPPDAPYPQRERRWASARNRNRATALPAPTSLPPRPASAHKRARTPPPRACVCANSPIVCIRKPLSRHRPASASVALQQEKRITQNGATVEAALAPSLAFQINPASDRPAFRRCVQRIGTHSLSVSGRRPVVSVTCMDGPLADVLHSLPASRKGRSLLGANRVESTIVVSERKLVKEKES